MSRESSGANAKQQPVPPLNVVADDGSLPALVRASELPVCLLDLETRQVIEASQPMAALLGGRREQLVRRDVTDFLVDKAMARSRLGLLASGELDGYRVFSRGFRRMDGEVVHLDGCVVAVNDDAPQRRAIAVVLPTAATAFPVLGGGLRSDSVTLGTVDEAWRIDRISADVEQLIGSSRASLVGQAISSLIAPGDWPGLLIAIGHGLRGEGGATTTLHLRSADGQLRVCRVLVTPLAGAANRGFAFALTGADEGTPSVADRAWELEGHIRRIAREVAASGVLAGLPGTPTATTVPAMAGLSSRELEIVTGLLEGERVPMIAERMFLSQSTVRNHLTSVYRKLGVHSQAELLRTLRKPPAASN